MITIKQIKGRNAQYYDKNYLSQNEYYSESETIDGRWYGKTARQLGIEGEIVTSEHFTALANNKHPITGEKLRPRISEVKFHDVTISAQKSYSIAAIIGKDERLIQGFQRAVEKTFLKLEAEIAVRDRRGNSYNSEKFATTGNGAAAVFLHDDNRLLDPQLHMHVVFSNHSFSNERGQYLALQPKMMMDESKRWITDYFHRELAKEALAAGYKVDLPENRLRLTGVGSELELTFSKRAQNRKKFEYRYEKVFGAKPDKKRIEHFIKDGQATAKKRFQVEYQAAFGKKPSAKLVDAFVVDWRTQKKVDLGGMTKEEYQRGQMTSDQALKVDSLVKSARGVSVDGLDQRIKEVVQARHEIEAVWDKTPKNEVQEETILQQEEPPEQKQRAQADKPKKKPQLKRTQVNAIKRTEAIRRMRRGMAITQALRGHPMVFMLQQISTLAQQNRK